MNTSTHDFVTVDMRGLKAALVAHAKTNRLSVSFVVRAAVSTALATDAPQVSQAPSANDQGLDGKAWVKLSVRVTRDEARRFDLGARAAGLSRGSYLAGLANRVPVLVEHGDRTALIASLVESNAALSTLSRNVLQLTALLRQGSIQQAKVYREMLDSLVADVRAHLKLASSGLSELQVRGESRRPPAGPASDGSRTWREE